jgi:hypothetical protein
LKASESRAHAGAESALDCADSGNLVDRSGALLLDFGRRGVLFRRVKLKRPPSGFGSFQRFRARSTGARGES